MSTLKNMPAIGIIVILIIAFLFALSLILLFYVSGRYKYLAHKAKGSPDGCPLFLRYAAVQYEGAYERFGEDVNTPAIIADAFGAKLGGLLFCERFLNNAVSLFVTLGLFGTFAGLSLSVSSLSSLISFSSSDEWLSVLNSVGGGLMSALSGMGVAFYTSLVGVACSIILTILKTIVNPEGLRGKLETRVELWLDQEIAPELRTEAPKKDAELVRRMIDALKETAQEAEESLDSACKSLEHTSEVCTRQIAAFDGSINKFNNGIHDFSEVDYNLRGSVERMDLVIRDLSATLKDLNSKLGGRSK